MNHFLQHPSFYNQPIRLDAEEAREPLEILQDFFQNCPLAAIRSQLWLLIEASLSVPHSELDDASHRQSLLWLYRELERALEAAWLLSKTTT